MSTENHTFQPDESQLRVIELGKGYHLVLAPPGCGKTQILTERVSAAHRQGIDYADMLMLTFTNRAARSMNERISAACESTDTTPLFIGNVHRYCSQFLFSNSILSANTSVIDDEDAFSILADYFSEDEQRVMADFKRRSFYAQLIHLANYMRQLQLDHKPQVRVHPESLSKSDVDALRWLCNRNRRNFDRQATLDIYNNADRIVAFMQNRPLEHDFNLYVEPLLQRFMAARLYADYKQKHNLVDFNDLLILTYHALINDAEGQYHRYRWIQIDEVQDLNPLQLAIVDQLTSQDFHSITYLGDEQQAIFSFMGAKLSTLNQLKERCRGSIFHLSENHRSPSYLLDVFNAYAENVLNISSELLPISTHKEMPRGNELLIIDTLTPQQQMEQVARQTSTWQQSRPDDTTAIIVQSNREADMLSTYFTNCGIKHFKVSGQDIFNSPQIRLIMAHLEVSLNPNSFISWARLLTGLGVCQTASTAREFISKAAQRAITPADMLIYNQSTYIEHFVETANRCIVVFDTETTGLDVASDDIIQIAAQKIQGGHEVEGSAFCVYIETERHIPEMLGEIENPIIEERRHQKLYSHSEALRLFLDYSKGCTLLGHNATFDYSILSFNLKRYLPDCNLTQLHPEYFDTLLLSHLLVPRLKQYKLKYLISELSLEGSNTHLADADVEATCSLVLYCLDKARAIVPQQREFLSQPSVQQIAKKLREEYAPHYLHARQQMLETSMNGSPIMVEEMLHFYGEMLRQGHIQELSRIKNVCQFLAIDVISADSEPTLLQQLQGHLKEISSFKESDLCASSSIDEHVFITTIHKAKGLEFDNVVVYDVRDDRLPGSFYATDEQMNEKKRLLYVAISRAKHRLALSYTTQTEQNGAKHEQRLTRFADPIQEYFH